MDTRDKIIPGDAAVEVACGLKRQGRKLVVVAGHFDVLLAAHARDLGSVRTGTRPDALMVVLLPVAAGLLGQRARAEMVAALSMVDYVVTAGESVEELLSRLPADQVVMRQSADEQQKRLLIEHVHSRHSL
jgi:glycerol-3-phosphate cytidylyltransferase-like family protein